jgi:hypothetical protein
MDWLEQRNNKAARIFLLINFAAVAATLMGGGAIQVFDLRPKLWVWLAAVLLLVLIQWFLWRSVNSGRMHSLREKTEAFQRFFSNWYAQDGQHIIYCSDLEWLEHPEHAEILKVLRQRAEHIEIFVRDDSSSTSLQLRQAGVAIHIVPQRFHTHVRMSLHRRDDQETLIVRRKVSRPDQEERIVFVESSDSYLLTLAKDLIDNCQNSP